MSKPVQISGVRGQRPDALPRLAGTWGQEIYSAVIELRSRADLISSDEQSSPAKADTLRRGERPLGGRYTDCHRQPTIMVGQRLVEWWSGSRVETCWSLLHEAESRLVAISAGGRPFAVAMESALAHVQRLDSDDPIRKRLENLANSYHPEAS